MEQKGWGKRTRVYYSEEEMVEKYPKQHEMFDIAKEELKK